MILESFGTVNCWETYVSGPNALFRGIEVVKMISKQIPPFYSIRLKIMFDSVLEHFVILPHMKICKTCVSDLNAVFRGTEVEYSFAPNASILLYGTKNDGLDCFRAFQKPL
jgi:hypothetical protein